MIPRLVPWKGEFVMLTFEHLPSLLHITNDCSHTSRTDNKYRYKNTYHSLGIFCYKQCAEESPDNTWRGMTMIIVMVVQCNHWLTERPRADVNFLKKNDFYAFLYHIYCIILSQFKYDWYDSGYCIESRNNNVKFILMFDCNLEAT